MKFVPTPEQAIKNVKQEIKEREDKINMYEKENVEFFQRNACYSYINNMMIEEYRGEIKRIKKAKIYAVEEQKFNRKLLSI
jgi:serine/threonine-protein kinase RIO1